MNDPQIRIKALWTQYGPRFHHKNRNTDCVSDCDSWILAGHDLQNWLDRHHAGKTPIFYGPSEESARIGWEQSNR
jgi:hypothetical protein